VGAEGSLELAIEVRELTAADRFLLCSDGLYGEMSDQDILRLLEQEDMNQACHDMVEFAKKNGAHDNVTVVAVQVMKAS
jgi:protein phosphatase